MIYVLIHSHISLHRRLVLLSSMVLQKEILEKLVLGLFCDPKMGIWYTSDVPVNMLNFHTIIDLITLTIITLKIYRVREGVGIATNNVAEYRAMILGMRYALKKGFTNICIQGDSKLVCMQVGHLYSSLI
jgi:hypothetical protein